MPGALEAFERRLAQAARVIARRVDTGDWGYAAPEGWWCSGGEHGCPHFEHCPGGLAATRTWAPVVSLGEAAKQAAHAA